MFDFVFGKSKKSTKGGDSPTDSGSTNDGFYQPMMLTDEVSFAFYRYIWFRVFCL